MFYSFAPYEQKIRAWAESGGFPEVNPLTRDYLLHVTDADAPRRLWDHQKEAAWRFEMTVKLFCELRLRTKRLEIDAQNPARTFRLSRV